jgi:hypothetical protein
MMLYFTLLFILCCIAGYAGGWVGIREFNWAVWWGYTISTTLVSMRVCNLICRAVADYLIKKEKE